METITMQTIRRPRCVTFLPVSVSMLSSTSINPRRTQPTLGHTSFARGFCKLYNNYYLSIRPIPFHSAHTRMSQFYDNQNENEKERPEEQMHVYKKNGSKRHYNGELLPFHVSTSSPPPEYLGRFMLDPTTHNGDIVEYDGRQFVVKRVRMRYKYQQGGFRMIGKTLEVNSLARKALESYLERTFNES